ncbi:hypothetical protein C8R45DRAFT_946703 [Mycena sanguinolenta]|nr:hypothetical protein C8R45DRAFT_946703 [Mycena sanguinolenta]
MYNMSSNQIHRPDGLKRICHGILGNQLTNCQSPLGARAVLKLDRFLQKSLTLLLIHSPDPKCCQTEPAYACFNILLGVGLEGFARFCWDFKLQASTRPAVFSKVLIPARVHYFPAKLEIQAGTSFRMPNQSGDRHAGQTLHQTFDKKLVSLYKPIQAHKLPRKRNKLTNPQVKSEK